MPSGAGGDPPDGIDDPTERLEAAATRAASVRAGALKAYSGAKDEAWSRAFVTVVIIGTWAATVVACAAAAFITMYRSPVNDAAAAQAAVANLSELLKVGVLPLTGIVVGYYLSRGR